MSAALTKRAAAREGSDEDEDIIMLHGRMTTTLRERAVKIIILPPCVEMTAPDRTLSAVLTSTSRTLR